SIEFELSIMNSTSTLFLRFCERVIMTIAFLHAPAEHVWPAGHAMPQPPQFCESVIGLTHCPPQVSAHAHCPPLHTSGVPALEQTASTVGSLSMTPSQSLSLASHVSGDGVHW